MAETGVIDRPTTDTALKHEDIYQVILHNDDKNTMEHVVRCLHTVFGHPMALAERIMLEAHNRGKAVAEVEPESQARLHMDQLRSYSLSVTIEKI